MRPLIQRAGTILAVVIFGVAACRPGIPDLGMPEVPAETLVQQLDSRREGLSSLNALAGLRIERKGRKRAFDAVGVLVDRDMRLKIEAYGPLGEPLITLLWLGEGPLVSIRGERAVNAAGPVMERLLGMSIDVKELAALLSGNVPRNAVSGGVRAFCGKTGSCVLEARQGGLVRRSWMDMSGGDPALRSYELFNSGGLVFRARFERYEDISGYLMPMRLIIENPERKVALTLEYEDVELNKPLGDELFPMPEEGAS